MTLVASRSGIRRTLTVPATALVVAAACRGGADAAAKPNEPAQPAATESTVTLDERARAFSNLQFALARRDDVQTTVNTTGTVAWDPAAVADVSTPVRGKVLELRGSVGDRVSAGEVVAVIESPDNLSGRFEVRTTRGGVITERAASVGQVLEAGGRLLRAVDDSRLWLLVDIPPTRGERPSIGSAVTADIPAAGARVRGKIGAILPEADTISHAARARVVIENPRRALAAGMSALVTAAVGRRVPAVVVPRSAVVYVNGRTVVFVPEGESFRAQQVETGPEVRRDEVAVLRGLVGGERVVTVGAQQLANANFNFKGLSEEEDEEAEP